MGHGKREKKGKSFASIDLFSQTDIVDETETLRPDFERRVERTVKNKVTDQLEPYVPAYKKFFYYTYVHRPHLLLLDNQLI